MELPVKYIFCVAAISVLVSCSTIEKASLHGFNSDYYKVVTKNESARKVYVNVTEEKIELHQLTNGEPEKEAFSAISLIPSDSLVINRISFQENSLDIDITAILLKYRPAVAGLQGQLTTDFNIALYSGWRHDNYLLTSKKDPLGITRPKFIHRGYDFGIFAGPGATIINPYTTNNKVSDEYSGLVIQTGVAGFIESNFASFGIAVGLDHLMSPDRNVWIYRNKPWIGFIVGVALN